MNKTGPIVIIEDDLDDQDTLDAVFKELAVKNQVIFFENGESAYKFLLESKEQPFLIISDINMPKQNGFELREKVHNNEQLRLKCIPYLFFTTTSEQKIVIAAYSKSVQGFFVKPAKYAEWVEVMKDIIDYWAKCHSPKVIV